MTELLFPLGGRRAWAVWATAVFTYLVTVLHRGSMSVAGLQAAERFDISASALASFTVVQLTVYAAMQVPVGVLLDRYGSKRLLIAASLLLFVAQSAFSLVDSYPAALAARAILGVGDALVFISVLRVVMSWFPALKQPVMSQVTGMLGGLGAIVSTVPMAAAFHAFGWTPTFAAASVLSLAAGAAVLLLLKDSPYDEPPRRAKQPLSVVRQNLRRAWKEPGTRLGLWTHFTTSFSGGTFGLLWGYPFLVQGQGVAPTTAAAMLVLPVLAGFCLRTAGRPVRREVPLLPFLDRAGRDRRFGADVDHRARLAWSRSDAGAAPADRRTGRWWSWVDAGAGLRADLQSDDPLRGGQRDGQHRWLHRDADLYRDDRDPAGRLVRWCTADSR